MRRLLLILSFLAAGAIPALAHPDIAMTVRLLFNFEGGNLTALAETWTFDASYSEHLIKVYDRNADGIFEPDEVIALKTKTEADLSHLGYLTHLIEEDGKALPLDLAAFHAEIAGGNVTVSLALKPPQALLMSGKSLSAFVADTDYIADMRLAEDRPVMIRGNASLNCTTTISPAPDRAYFGGLVTPEKVTLTCQ